MPSSSGGREKRDKKPDSKPFECARLRLEVDSVSQGKGGEGMVWKREGRSPFSYEKKEIDEADHPREG